MTVCTKVKFIDQKKSKEAIEIDVWEPYPENPGLLRFVRMKTVQEVYNELKARLEAENLIPDHYFNTYVEFLFLNKKPEEISIPYDYWGVVCFAVKGGSEGYCIHVGLILSGGKYQDLFIGKTLREGPDGLNYALMIANACTRAFYG